jgi:hypothetical protein
MKLGYKYFIATAILLLSLTGMVLAQSNPIITSVALFGGSIRVEWTINSEAGIDHYEVWRSTGSSDPIRVGIVQRGVFFYVEDKSNLNKTEDQYFSYQVKAVGGPNGTVQGQSEIRGISFITNSTAKRTWGSIKAMFR